MYDNDAINFNENDDGIKKKNAPGLAGLLDQEVKKM